MKRIARTVAAAGVILLVLGYFLMIRIPPDTVGVADTGRPGETPVILKPGLHFHPIGAKVATYATLPATASGEEFVTPVTGGEVPARFSVTGRLDPDRVGELHTAIAGRPLEEFLSAQTRLMLREYAAHLDAVDLLTPQFRSRAAETIAAVMRKGGFAEASVTLKPPDDDTLLAAAQYLAPRHEASKIRQTIAEALADPAGARSWELLTAMGLVDESERRLVDAEKHYLDALAINPIALPPMAELVTLYSSVKEWEKLQRILDAALTANPKSLQHINWMAVVLLKLEDYAGAERILKSGLDVEPDNTRLLANLGTVYVKMNRVDDALAALKRAVDTAPTNPQALFNMGSVLASTGRFSEALPLLERAEQSGSSTVPLLETLTLVNAKLGNKEKAASYRQRAKAMEAEQRSSKRPSLATPSKGEAHGTAAPTKSPS